MSSTLWRKLRYVKDRCINAYWMVRNGKFKLILKSIYIEIEHRINVVQEWLTRGEVLDDSQVPASAYTDQRKVIPPSYRPTNSQASTSIAMQAESAAVAIELESILSTMTVEESNQL